jgi:hydroxymethylpyrimidine kinase/phosphomethylpyrimidine kinase
LEQTAATRVPNLLTIAGLDPSGGAGIAGDLKTFAALRCHGMAVVTALTVQNTKRVFAMEAPGADFIARQIDAIFEDIEVAAVKIGMLATPEAAAAVAARLAVHKPPFIVLDPVLAATSGDCLAREGLAEAIADHLLPLATLITPNWPEAAILAGYETGPSAAGFYETVTLLHKRGARAVLLTGGDGAGLTCDDLLSDGTDQHIFSAPRIITRNTHGTGCTLSSAIAAYLAHGHDLVGATGAAKTFLNGALAAADDIKAGRGHGPLNHFHALWRG